MTASVSAPEPLSPVERVIGEQLAANRSSLGERARFAGHRERLTALCGRHAGARGERSLCVLGAGNANDLDLERLAARYRAIHLVDLDAEALEAARERESAATRARLVPHAPVDVSGMLDRLTRWAAWQVTPEELAQHPLEHATTLAARLGGPFDVVLSACLLTQMQLGVLTVLGDRHQLFEAVRHTLTLSHLSALSRLTAPGGQVLVASDLSASEIAPSIMATPDELLPELVPRLVAEGRVFQVAQPGLVRSMVLDSPVLARELELGPALEAWRWQNGPTRCFLVYALEGRRLPA